MAYCLLFAELDRSDILLEYHWSDGNLFYAIELGFQWNPLTKFPHIIAGLPKNLSSVKTTTLGRNIYLDMSLDIPYYLNTREYFNGEIMFFPTFQIYV